MPRKWVPVNLRLLTAIPVKTNDETNPARPYLTALYLRAPTYMMVGRNDEMVHCNRQVQQAVYDKIAAPKAFYEIEGGHFGLLWNPGPLFDEAAARQTAFLKGILG